MAQLEICVDSVESALAAEEGGADRVELCCALSEGGLTPSLGLLRSVRSKLSIGVHAMIRPRGGDFVYSPQEFEVMQSDIVLAGEAGANGIVFGLLTRDGDVDLERTRQLVALARPMEVTFHRAIDVAIDPLAAIESIIASGADRVLTSGGEVNAALGREQIRKLVAATKGRIRIMVGGGVRAANLPDLTQATRAEEWHTTARRSFSSTETPAGPLGALVEQMGGGVNQEPILSNDVRQLRQILDQTSAMNAAGKTT